MILWSCVWQSHMTIEKCISTATVLTSTRFRQMVTQLEGLLTINSHAPWVTWSCWIRWPIKSILYLLWQCLWPLNLAEWWLILRGSYLKSHMALESLGTAKSWDKLKPLHIHYQHACSHQTWQVVDISWGAPNHKVTWLYDHMILWDLLPL